MPVSICDQPAVRTALLESLCSSENSRDQLDRKLVISAKRVLMTHIEYEDSGTYQANNLDALKRKYIILNTNKKNQEKESENGLPAHKEVLLPKPKKILFPKESVQLGWSNNRRWNPGSGMVNMGNTCYLNSTLQALFHVPSLANWLISDTEHSSSCEDNGGGQGGCIICAMTKTLLTCQSNSSPSKPWLIYSKLKIICRHFVPGRQEDAHEFLRHLVEAMEKSYLSRFKLSKEFDQYTKETTPFNQILGGYLRTTVKCLRCGHVSITFQHFQDLLLDIRKANTLDEALETYFACERLEDMGYKCEGCKHKVSATKQFSLERFPSVLCIQLKRFSMIGNKINKHIEFSSKLDISKFYCNRKIIPLTYRLVAMVTHIGSSQNCGHYTAIGQSCDGSYYQFDDSSVRSLPLTSVLATNAYIMLYELEKTATLASHTLSPHSLANNSSNNNQHKLISAVNNNEKVKTFTPTLKPFSDDIELVDKNGDENKKKFIGPVLPPGYNSQELSKSHNNNTKYSPLIPKSPGLLSKSIITNGSKLVKPSVSLNSYQQNKSMPIIDLESNTKKKSTADIFSSQGSKNLNGITAFKSDINITKQPQIDSVNKQIQLLKVNGQPSNTTTSNVKSLVPYDGSDDSNSEVDMANKKQEISIIPGWTVSSTKNPAALSPSLNGKTCRSPKKKVNSDNDKSPIKIAESSDTVRQLLRMSHQGYSAPVPTWNGERSHLEKEIAEERREQRKRPVDEIDQGRTKKVKSFHYQGRDNPGYNPFQEYQNSRQNQDSRWHHQGNHGRPYNNHHRNSYNNHRGAFNRGRHKPHNQRHGYYRR